nr:hypothetical protein [Tanacetum cinerariifolium]
MVGLIVDEIAEPIVEIEEQMVTFVINVEEDIAMLLGIRCSKILPLLGMIIPTARYLQHEHYALWEVIEFGDSYKAPLKETAKDKGLAGEVFVSTKKKERTMAISVEDMHKSKNDVKARTTLL